MRVYWSESPYNPGGATIALNTGETDIFDAEYMWDYEAFAKGTVPSLRLTVAANLFYNDKRDAQRGVAVPFTLPGGGHDFFIRFNNVPKAHAYGGELELSWLATDNLTLRSGVGTLWTRIDRPARGDEIGREFERGPHWSGSASAGWTPVRRLQLFAQVRYRSGFYSDNFETPELHVSSAMSVDARASYEIGRFNVFAYARNVFDKLNIIYRYLPTEFAELEDPRMVGVGLETRF